MHTWFSTLPELRAGVPDWQAIAAYERPLQRFLRRLYPGVSADVIEEATHDVLLAMRTSVVERYNPGRGRFRDYVKGVARNQLRQVLGKNSRGGGVEFDMERIPAPSDMAWERFEAEAWLLGGIEALQGRLLAGGQRDREVLYCFLGRTLHGLTYPEIARREGLSEPQVSRRLAEARCVLLEALLLPELERLEVTLRPRALRALVGACQDSLASARPLSECDLRVADEAQALVAGEALLEQIRLVVVETASGKRTLLDALHGLLG